MNLTDTQLIVLTKASQRAGNMVLPLPENLKGGAQQMVVKGLLKRGLIEEVDANTRVGEKVWRETGDGHCQTLVLTDAGLIAIGLEPEEETKPAGRLTVIEDSLNSMLNPAYAAAKAKTSATKKAPAKPAKKAAGAPKAAKAPKAPKPAADATVAAPREGTKQATMIEMLRRKQGATVAEIAAETGWQNHTIRGAFAGALKKRLGLNVESEKDEKRGRVYRIAA